VSQSKHPPNCIGDASPDGLSVVGQQ